ncbi:helix-turn-helix transcriptional regulator [Psychroserpens sp. SPM9]|uniref:helix-turn-helix transcriptional regulator n=1 Tax=Psychroserpens sp. SPM9 TaxID=2975598 RepID=UPI0021A3E0E2|nr:helix-turn-helix transcriptional regulator [Psychroserpens sp. SPM9]MDG5492353.1 helix-turn-helix transcriptional regulator [Psychroserpens sp. SPM9]
MKILSKGEYYGSMKSEQKCHDVILSEYNYLIPKTDWHYHENPYLMYVLQGDLYDVNKKATTTCGSGSLFFYNWDEPHFNAMHSTSAKGFHIEFDRQWFKNKQLDANLWEGSRLIQHPDLHHIMAKLYFEFKCRDIYSDVSIELLLLQLCEGIDAIHIIKTIDEPLWISKLKEILHQNSHDLNLKSLSEALDVHPAHISRAVPQYLKTTLGDYIRRHKVKQAIGYLMNSNLSLTDITYRCGFSDQSHFTRLFKLYIGMTPKQYKNKMG